jgi:ABC-type multidrug transport system ATPase subunit
MASSGSSTASSPVIAAHLLTKQFGPLTAVANVSFEIPRGAIFGLLGPNGSGKSTIIRMLCGILRPTSGSASVAGVDVFAYPEQVKGRIGYMSQHFGLYRDMTSYENITFYGMIYGLNGAQLNERRNAVVELVGLTEHLHKLAGQLSGGWQQRLALACALLHQPSILFLDEPTAGIDPVARRLLWDLLFQLSGQGITFLVTTHYMDEAERCTEVGYMYMSRLIALGDPADLKALPEITPPDARWLEVDTEHPTIALALLRKLAGVRSATIFGQLVHLLVDKAVDETAIGSALAQAGMHEIRIIEVRPSLEDVFVALTGRQRDEEMKGMKR